MSRSINYGLKKQPDYDEIQDYLNNKQPKLKFPDRLATFIRRTNQMSNLLDGEGYSLFDLEMQQQNIIMEQLKALTINAMADANSTAKVLKVIAKSKPKSQLPPNFDIAKDDKNDPEEQLSNDIEMVSTQQSQQVAQNKTKITNLLQAHLDPSPMDTAHAIASSSGASSSNYMPPNMEGIPLNDVNMSEITQKPKAKGRPKKIQQSEEPDTMLIDKDLKRPLGEKPKGKVGRPRKITLSEVSDPMLIDKELKRPETNMPDDSPQKKKFKKLQKHSDKLHPILNKLPPKKQEVESTNDDEPETTHPNPSLNIKKAPITKQTVKQTEKQKRPSDMNIQLLRETLEHAKINNKLSHEDGFAYAKLMAEFYEAKGKPEIKKQKIAGMREIYKRALYKK